MLIYKDNNIIYKYEFCQQCGACKAVCPKNAISFIEQPNGLKKIKVDHESCIRCKKCVNVCPSNRKMGTEADAYVASLKDKQFYLSHNEVDEIRCSCSSGGAIKTIVINGLKQHTVDGVYSLCRTDGFPFAKGVFYTAENIPEYDTMPNSVYHSVMACTEIAAVKRVKKLMIVGTSCQLYALEKSLAGKYEKLIKVCVFCKQQKTLDSTRFIAKMMGTKISADRNFRCSYRGNGWPGTVSINGMGLSWERVATLPFGRRLWTVPGCNICGDPFGIEAGADISVMDPWSIHKSKDLGDSLVTVYSETGKELVKNISGLKSVECSYDEVRPALGLGDVWRKRMCVPAFKGEQCEQKVEEAVNAEIKQRAMLEKILEGLPKMPSLFYRVLNKIVPKSRDKILSPVPEFNGKKSVKVITRHAPSNYGSLLQSIATLRVLSSLGVNAQIINYQRQDERSFRKVRTEAKHKYANAQKQIAYQMVRYPIERFAEMKFDKMRSRYLDMTQLCHTHEDLKRLSADLYLTGSDQVWGPMANGAYDSAYFLEFVEKGNKVAYSASFGRTKFNDATETAYKQLLSTYEKIAVREENAVKLVRSWGLENCIGRVLDPALLLQKNQWNDLMANRASERKVKEPYALVYQLGNNAMLSEYAKSVAKKKNLKLVRVNPFLHQVTRGGEFKLCPDVMDFLDLIKNADVLITDSFHGTCFAIVFNTQFVEVLPLGDSSIRNKNLLEVFGLSHRIVNSLEEYGVSDEVIDYNRVNAILDAERRESIEMLKEILGEV